MKEFSTYFLGENKEKLLFEVRFIETGEDLSQYQTYLKSLPENPFLTKELLIKTSNQEIGYFTLFDNSNTLLVLYPFFYRKIFIQNRESGYYDITSPYGFGGPIFKRETDEGTMKHFWDQVDKWYIKNNVVSEFIRFYVNENYIGYTGSLVPTLKMVCGKILDDQEQWAKFRPKVRNNIRNAIRNDLKGKVYYNNITREIIRQFHAIYSKTMERHNAESRYRFSFEFFNELISENPETCAIAIVYKGDKAISVELILMSYNTVYSFLGGTDEDYFYARPNDLLKLKIINWAREKGFEYYFLGGGRTEEDTLYRYKKKFFPNDKDHIFYTGRKILNIEVYDILARENPILQEASANEFFPLYRYKGI